MSISINKILILLILISSFSSCKKKLQHIEISKISDNSKVTLAFETKAKLGEGAFWNHKTNELYWIDIEGKKLHIYNPKTKQNQSFDTPSRIGTVVPIDNQKALIALEDGVYIFDLKTGKTTLFTDMKSELKNSRLNDGKCDPSGRLWVGSMHFNQTKGDADLYSIDSKGNLSKKIDNVTISNGIVWTKDKKTMYYIDTPTSKIKSYDFDDEKGTISNEKVAVEIPKTLGFPDGMAIDEDDMLWVGMWNGNAVIRFNPKTGKVLRKIEIPAHNVTSCAFGGDDLQTLYITTARVDMTPEELKKYPLSGSVFKVNLGIKGVKSSFFKNNL